MEIVIHIHQLEIEPSMTAQLRRDVRAFLGLFERWIRGITVRIHGDATEAALATCCVLVDLHGGGGLAVEQPAPTPETALLQAAFRMRTSLADHLRRRQGLPPDTRWGYGVLPPAARWSASAGVRPGTE